VPRWTFHLGLLVSLLLAQLAPGQERGGPTQGVPRPASAPQPGASNASPAGALLPEWPLDVWYLWDNGKPVVVPDGANVTGYLKYLVQQRKGDEGPEPYGVARIACSGMAEDDRLQLTVEVQVQMGASDAWVQVPLQMVEATLRKPVAYAGQGEFIQAPYHPESGYGCWLKGKGTHELTLSLTIPVRKQPAGRRVQLSLPMTAVSSLNLRVPHSHVTARSSEKSIVTVRNEPKFSEIEVIGLGARLDLAWQPLPEAPSGEIALEVASSISASLTEAEQSATLEAVQSIRSLVPQGLFDEVRVTLPRGSELLRIEGTEYLEHRTSEASPGPVLVKLKRPTAGPVDLRWRIRMPLPPAGTPFTLEGFDVDRARIHTGILALAIVGNFRVLALPEDNRDEALLQRINIGDLPAALRQPRTMEAYRFSNRVRLRLSLQRVSPYVTSVPTVWLRVDPQELEFAATYSMHVLRGSVAEVRLAWPGWREDHWNIEAIDASDDLDPQLVDDEPAPDTLRVAFAQPARGPFELTIRARRELAPGVGSVPVTLPLVDADSRSSALLAVLSPPDLEVELQAHPRTVLRTQADTAARVSVPRELQKLHRDDYRIESSEAAFVCRIAAHPRDVAASTTVEASPRSGTVAVSQRIAYDVTHGSVAHVRLLLPGGLAPGQFKVVDAEGVELSARVEGDASSRTRLVRLDPPHTGHFELELRYALAAAGLSSSDDEQAGTIPLVVAADAEFSAVESQWRDAAGRDAVVQGEGWERVPGSDGSWVWTLARPASEINVVLSHSVGGWSGATVRRALIRTRVGADGTVRTVAEYRISGDPPDLAVSFAPGVQPVGAWWDCRDLKLSSAETNPAGVARYAIVPERETGSEALLTVETISRRTLDFRFAGEWLLTAPRLPDSLPILDCVWQVTLPSSQHLFVEPVGFVPQFHWVRSGILWGREPNRSSDQLEGWVGTCAPRESARQGAAGNVYLFGRAAAPEALRFRTMSQSGIVLVGAGTALLFGFVLVRVPAARNVLTLLVAGFAVSLLAVCFTGPVVVLLQPAALGFLLAGAAAAFDRAIGRTPRSVGALLPSTGGFVVSNSSVAHSPSPVAGRSEFSPDHEPGFDRPPESAEPAGRLSESGSQR
jgi:hypothetical protein